MLSTAQFEQLAAAARQDPELLMRTAFWISTKNLPGQPPITRLALNVPQLKVDRALMAQRRAGKPPRAIVLKARQTGLCLDPATRVLTADLRWIPLGDVQPGIQVVAVDRDYESGGRAQGRGRKLATATVLATETVKEPAYCLIFADGRELIATAQHRFLSRKRGETHTCWRRVRDTRPGDVIRYIVSPWSKGDFEDGWFGGMLDGEGCVRTKGYSGFDLSVSQVAGPVYERLLRYVQDRRYTFFVYASRPGPGTFSHRGVYGIHISRMADIFTVLGRTRPTRFLQNHWWEGKCLPGRHTGLAWMQVVKIEPVGEREMIDLQTTTGTFIAEGFVSHNSTLGAGYLLATALTQPHSAAMLVAHLDDSAVALFKKVQFMADRLPSALRPTRGATRRNELVLDRLACTDGDVELRSRMTVASATGGEQWRGATLQCAHISEFAYFPRPEETLLGILQAVPPHPQSLVLIESTANGMGDRFQEEFDRAVAGASDFVPVFVPWFEMSEYRMAVPPDFDLDPEEKEIKRAFHLSNEQMQWRRYVLFTQCAGNADRLAQEFPSTSSEAFLVSGRPAFPVRVLREMQELALAVPTCDCVPHHHRVDGPPHAERGILLDGKFVRIARAPLAVYRRPVVGHDYTIGADSSAGEEGGDPAAIAVFDRDTGEFVAIWHGYQNPVVFAHTVAELGHWYNQALLAPEVNNHGHVVMAELKNLQYQRYYIWQRADRIRNTFTNYFGWWTTWSTRPLLIDTFAHALTEREIVIYHPETVSELLRFQWVNQQRAEGLGRDDLCFAAMIAYRAHIEMPLLATGIPPRVRWAEPEGPPTVQQGPPLNGLSREAWAETDETLADLAKGHDRLAEQYVFPDEFDPSAPLGLDDMPDLPY